MRLAIDTFAIDNGAILDEIVGRVQRLFPAEYAALLRIHRDAPTAAELRAAIAGPVESTLKHLVGYQLIEAGPDGRYRARFALLRRWLDRLITPDDAARP
ncbi:MAG: hypothetical protein U1F43_36450 [Myxococcota bacterium]